MRYIFKIIINIGILSLALSCFSNAIAVTKVAETCEYEDVKAAYDSANDGDTILVPAGSATWTSTLSITKGISLVGATTCTPSGTPGESGYTISCDDATTITNGAGDNLINILPTSNESYVEITGFTFDGNEADENVIYLAYTNGTYNWMDFRIHHNKFIDVGSSSIPSAIYTYGDTYGLIDHNYFDVAYTNGTSQAFDLGITGNQDTSWSKNPVSTHGMGTEYFLYIEDNVTKTGAYEIVHSGHGARWIYRHNTIDNSNMSYGDSLWDIHGNSGGTVRACIAVEIYENTATATGSGLNRKRAVFHRGGTAMIFNNSVQSQDSINSAEEDECDTYPTDTIMNSYYWGNINSNESSELRNTESDGNSCIAEKTSWWDDINNDTEYFTTGEFASRPVGSEDDCYWATDTNNLYRYTGKNWIEIYQPYTYPHPLSLEVDDEKLPGTPINLEVE